MRKLNIDKISVMADEDLYGQSSKIKNLLTYKNQKDNKKHLEIELCYLQREIFIREKRRRAHDDFLQKRSRRNK